MADSLTDAELRKELVKLGEDVGPINATTRKLWLKKLKTLRNNKTNIANRHRSSAATKKAIGFSSDESEDERKDKTRQQKRRVGRPAATNKASNKIKAEASTKQTQSFKSPEVTSRPALRRRSTKQKDVSKSTEVKSPPSANSTFIIDDSDSDIAELTIPKVSISTNTSPTVEQHLSFDVSTSRPGSSCPGSSQGLLDSTFTPIRTPLTSTPQKGNRLNKQSTPLIVENSALKFKRTIDKSDEMYMGDLPTSFKYNNHNKNNTWKQDTSHDDSLSDEEDIRQQGFKTEDPVPSPWSQYISAVLVVGLTLFFLALGAMYINMREVAERTSNKEKDNLMVCGTSKQLGNQKGPCFSESKVSVTLPVLQALYEELSYNAGLFECGYVAKYRGHNISVGAVKQFLNNKFGKDEYYWDVMVLLILNNPHWHIRLYGKDTAKAVQSHTEVWWLDCVAPRYPLLCKVQRFLWKIINWIVAGISAILLILMVILISRYYQRKQQEEKMDVYDMVENIIETLKGHYDRSEENKSLQPYMAIPHVRDMLILPQDRKKKQHIWNKAVKFLAANESRVRVENQIIAGEEFPVWRWLHGYAANTSKGKKMWQGQAFGDSPSNRTNMLPFSPTPCLKIRNMFDPDIEVGEWDCGIKDVILEKCKDINDIVHIAVDKTSKEGCVYLKCGTPVGAGKVYKSLHGWWFDGNLVTVKFLRLERYHERFPDAKECKTPMKPSSANSSWFSTL